MYTMYTKVHKYTLMQYKYGQTHRNTQSTMYKYIPPQYVQHVQGCTGPNGVWGGIYLCIIIHTNIYKINIYKYTYKYRYRYKDTNT